MGQPVPYDRLKDFTTYALAHTAQPYNASDHDAEFDAVELTLDGLVVNIALIQRNDGLLANQTVHPDALSTATKALIGAGNTGQTNWTPRGLWVTATAYALGNVVETGGVSYVCATAHTSGVFATDHTAGKWIVLGPASTSAVNVSYTPGFGALAGIAHTVQSFLDKLAQAGTALGAALLGFMQDGQTAGTTVQAQLQKTDVVDTLTILKTWPVAPAGKIVVTVLGFSAAGDGGGGMYWWDSASSTADDGGEVIQLNIGGVGRFKKLRFA